MGRDLSPNLGKATIPATQQNGGPT